MSACDSISESLWFFLSRYSVLTSSVFLQWSSVPFGAAEHASGFLIFKGSHVRTIFGSLFFNEVSKKLSRSLESSTLNPLFTAPCFF